MPDAARSIVVICEAAADQRTACGLADRVLCGEIDWFSSEMLDSFRRWRGLRKNEAFLAWKHVPALARKAGVKVHGHFDGTPGAPDARAARLVLALLAKEGEGDFDAVMLIRDSDGDGQRRQGLEQARAATPGATIVIGVAHTKRECWILAGFEPRNEVEFTRFEETRRELGFDPREQAEALDAKARGARRNAKRVVEELLGGNPDRETACWLTPSLELLAERGSGSGLAAFLDEVREHMVSLWAGSTSD